jgi:hypothetical protein
MPESLGTAVDPGDYFELSLDELREVSRFALASAEEVLTVYKGAVSDDNRPPAAFAAAPPVRRWWSPLRRTNGSPHVPHRAAKELPQSRHRAQPALPETRLPPPISTPSRRQTGWGTFWRPLPTLPTSANSCQRTPWTQNAPLD